MAIGGARLIGLRNTKVRAAVDGRSAGIRSWVIGASDERRVALIHVASAGEFEGARPLIDRLIATGQARVAVSFSSPSALPVVESAKGLWAWGYLPMDLLPDQLRLLAALDPAVILIFKHDFWPNMIRAAAALRIPIGLINANFHARSRRSSFISASFHRSFMRYLDFVWTVSEADSERVRPLLTSRTELVAGGDTRYDRVLQRAEAGRRDFISLREALAASRVIVGGSTWPPDEEIIWSAFAELRRDYPDLKLLLVPHEPTAAALEHNLHAAKALGLEARLYSRWQEEAIAEPVMLVDRTGILAGLYSVGWAAYVGGGFGRGIHSVIEPAAHGLPVCFGPNYHVSHEAGLLLKNGGGCVFNNAHDLIDLWDGWLRDELSYRRAGQAALDLVKSHAGATDRLMTRLAEYL